MYKKTLSLDSATDDTDASASTEQEESEFETKEQCQVSLKRRHTVFLPNPDEIGLDTSLTRKKAETLSKNKILNKIRTRNSDKNLNKKKVNKKIQNKEARARGKAYVKFDGSIAREKELLPNPCKNCVNRCANICERKRKNIFDYYWSLSVQQKRRWLFSMISKEDVKRKRNRNSTHRRNTFKYYFPDGEERHQVCLQFILKTLNITQRFVRDTLRNIKLDAKSDTRVKRVPANKTPESIKKLVVDFIRSLPAAALRYCRKGSTRLYLSTEFKSLNNLYRIYKEECLIKGVKVVHEKGFRNIFNKDFNLGFHVPKRGQCVKCLNYGFQNSTVPEMNLHLQEVKASEERFNNHSILRKVNPTTLCTSIKLQKVLNTPYGNTKLLFHVRKYCVNNLCFYESVTKKGFCYMWGETEGDRSNSEIATIVHKYIGIIDQRETVKDLILYTDPCPGRNKNKILLSAIHNALLLSKNLKTIQVNFMLSGHSELPVDSIHSNIKNSIRNVTIWAPSQWYTVFQLARKEPSTYEVESLTHEDFKNFNDLSEINFKEMLTIKISKIRIATFNKSTPDIITVKYSMKEDATEENIPMIPKLITLTSKYKTCLPITKTKYNDLKKICDTSVMPKIFHAEYLKFSTYNGRDVLIESDMEDNALIGSDMEDDV